MLQNKIVVFILFAFSTIIFFGCNDSPTDLGSEYLTQDGVIISKFDTSVDSMDQTFTPFIHVYSLASSDFVMVGAAENVTSQVLMKFVFGFADSIQQSILNDSIIIKDAWIEMYKDYHFGDSTANFDYEVRKINNLWTASFSADSFSTLTYDATDLSSEHNIDSDTLYTFRIDHSLVESWLLHYADTTQASNNGILISPTASTRQIIGFTGYNYDAVDDPQLKIVFEKPGVYSDTITGYISSDISIVRGEMPSVSSENVALQSSLSAQGILYFDLSVIPDDAVVNSATLTLTVDESETKTGSTYTNSLRAYLFATTDTTDYGVNSDYVETLSRNNNTFTGSVTDIVRGIHSGTNNEGFLIKNSSDLNGVEIFAIKGSNAANISERPRLEIIYSRKK